MNLRKIVKRLSHKYCPGLKGWFRYFGTRVYFPHKAWIFDLACEQGIYESELLRLICGLARPQSWYFDIGANIGLMSVPVLRQRTDLKVLSFEPSPNSSPHLKRTLKESGLEERWQIRVKAVGKAKGQAEFTVGEARLAGYDGLKHTERVAKLGTHQVEITTLDDEWDELGKPDVSFMKLDIEGAELEALVGGVRLLQKCRPKILLEWYAENLPPYGVKASDLLRWAEANNYEVVSVPTMTVVRSTTMLDALMLATSAFLLLPADGPLEKAAQG